MPGVTIEIRRKPGRQAECALIEAVAGAITGALDIPQSTLALRLIVHEPWRFALPRDRDERFTLVTIDCFEGRPLAVKRALYAALVERLAGCGIPPDHLKILLREAPRENWGIRGGVPASEVGPEPPTSA